jgi:hypothetical protein
LIVDLPIFILIYFLSSFREDYFTLEGIVDFFKGWGYFFTSLINGLSSFNCYLIGLSSIISSF